MLTTLKNVHPHQKHYHTIGNKKNILDIYTRLRKKILGAQTKVIKTVENIEKNNVEYESGKNSFG
jgi:hypothetical protein